MLPTGAPKAGIRPGLVRWASAVLLVTVGWLVTPEAVPIYDGIGNPDEPYRYVSAPAGTPVTAKPTGAQTAIPVVGGLNAQNAYLKSNEVGPQVSVFLPKGGLATSGGTISAKVVPIAPTTQPAGGLIDGNVYELSFSSKSGPVTFTAEAVTAYMTLRATIAKPAPVMHYRAGPDDQWRATRTDPYGFDMFDGVVKGAGQYALVRLLESPPAETGAVGGGGAVGDGGGGHQVLIVALLVALIVLLSVVLRVRWRDKRVPQ